MLGKLLESPLVCNEIKAVPKENQPWIFIGKTDAEAEVPILCPPDAKSQFIGKDPEAGNDWGQEKKQVTENEMVPWHYWISGHVFEQTLGNSEGQGSLARCSSWDHKVLDKTEQLNKNKKNLELESWHKGWAVIHRLLLRAQPRIRKWLSIKYIDEVH